MSLRQVMRVPMSSDMVALLRRKLVINDGLHHVCVSTRGAFAQRMLFVGVQVRVTDSYRVTHMRGTTGVIVGVHDGTIDADGRDEYNYPVLRAIPFTTVTVRITDHYGQWIFTNPADLENCGTVEIFESGMPVGGYYIK